MTHQTIDPTERPLSCAARMSFFVIVADFLFGTARMGGDMERQVEAYKDRF